MPYLTKSALDAMSEADAKYFGQREAWLVRRQEVQRRAERDAVRAPLLAEYNAASAALASLKAAYEAGKARYVAASNALRATP